MFYKKALSTVMALMLLINVSPTVSATSGSCGTNVFWDLNEITGALTIYGTGNMTDYTSYSDAPWIQIDIKSVTICSGVTSIGSHAFHGRSSLTSVPIPSSVTSIGSFAFYYCSSLTSVTIPSSVTSIGDDAFYYCSGLTSVTYLGKNDPGALYSAFGSCPNLPYVSVPSAYTSSKFCGKAVSRPARTPARSPLPTRSHLPTRSLLPTPVPTPTPTPKVTKTYKPNFFEYRKYNFIMI